jgi:sec-independent protein translocase protein TatA
MFGYSWGPILLILLVVLILFGPRRLPELGESIGKAIKSFKKAHDDPESMAAKPEIPPSPTAQLTNCTQCHQNFSGEFTFCPHCGNKVAKV